MKKIRIVIFVIIGLALALALALFLFDRLKPKVAGIYIETIPASTVYIDGVEMGRTPYEKTRKPGEIIIKLVPDSFELPLVPYETRVNLTSGVQTVIKRYFGETEETSSGEIISFEKIEKNQVSLAVVSIPDSAELVIDGSERAYTPHRLTSLLPGVHTINLNAEGFQEKRVDVRTHEGYKLTAVIKLAKAEIQEGLDEGQPGMVEDEVKKDDTDKVKILSTPTGYLRVRSEPTTLSSEVGTVEPDKTYELLETDEKTGWHKIKFIQEDSGEEKEGWITNQYSQVLSSDTPTPSPPPTPNL